ncbi:O-linked n-acetylglucosamine transferase ogt, partial [Globisporangium splendens]
MWHRTTPERRIDVHQLQDGVGAGDAHALPVRANTHAPLRACCQCVTHCLQDDLEAGRTLYNAIRSGATDSYHGVKSDWQRERKFGDRFADMHAIQRWNRKRAFVTVVRSQFEQPVDEQDKRAVGRRIDAAFAALREIDDHNAMVRNLAARGAFQPKKRTEAVKYCIGDVVDVNDVGLGVVTGWTVARSHAFADLHVTYDILPHSTNNRHVCDTVGAILSYQAVSNPSLLLYFDGFENGHHIPSAPLARRFPNDVSADATSQEGNAAESTYTPSILQLQFADEAKLVQYLRCSDATVIQFASAALEGKWIGAAGDDAQASVRQALKMMDMGEHKNARNVLLQVVHAYPDYAYAWSKLGMAELRAGDAETALGYFETALEKNPQLLDALTGLGTCATKLQRWSVAHSAALRLMRIQPDNEAARILLESAIFASL